MRCQRNLIQEELAEYFDSIRIPDVYTKSLDDIILDALKWNAESF